MEGRYLLSTTLVYVSLVLGICGTLLTIIVGSRGLFRSWQKKTIEEAENTKAIKENTAAVLKLTALYTSLEERVIELERRNHAV